ncbi:SocA family protein [Parabacteroides sp. OttesenSCG-928-N08]|nr:SocA family protein [Parabacteroides sp. OttesenSCG-928-N08]
MEAYSKDTIEKLGNAIIYLADRVPDLSKTKLLKLIYLLEEMSVKKNKLPFFGIPFEVWKAGPVAKTLFIDLSSDLNMLQNYISVVKDDGRAYITAKSTFNDDEFSDADMEIMDLIIDKFGNKTATELVAYLHKTGSPWLTLAQQHRLIELFDLGITNSSDVKIDMTCFLSESEKERYNQKLEFDYSIAHLKP